MGRATILEMGMKVGFGAAATGATFSLVNLALSQLSKKAKKSKKSEIKRENENKEMPSENEIRQIEKENNTDFRWTYSSYRIGCINREIVSSSQITVPPRKYSILCGNLKK